MGQVLKPGVSGVLMADLGFLYLASKALQFLNPALARLSLADITEDIRASMLDEASGRGGKRRGPEEEKGDGGRYGSAGGGERWNDLCQQA
jgi:hypothetical protein